MLDKSRKRGIETQTEAGTQEEKEEISMDGATQMEESSTISPENIPTQTLSIAVGLVPTKHPLQEVRWGQTELETKGETSEVGRSWIQMRKDENHSIW